MPLPLRQPPERHEQYKRHKSYLRKVRNTSLFCPRYDMLSLNNNLLLHRNYDPRKDLMPKRPSAVLRELQGEIKKKIDQRTTTGRIQGKSGGEDGPKWYESVLREPQVRQKKFQFEYQQAESNGFSVRESLNRLYQTRGKICTRDRTRGTTFYAGSAAGKLE